MSRALHRRPDRVLKRTSGAYAPMVILHSDTASNTTDLDGKPVTAAEVAALLDDPEATVIHFRAVNDPNPETNPDAR